MWHDAGGTRTGYNMGGAVSLKDRQFNKPYWADWRRSVEETWLSVEFRYWGRCSPWNRHTSPTPIYTFPTLISLQSIRYSRKRRSLFPATPILWPHGTESSRVSFISSSRNAFRPWPPLKGFIADLFLFLFLSNVDSLLSLPLNFYRSLNGDGRIIS